MTDTEELKTGFGSWVARQPKWSEAGKLAEALREDLARAGRSEWPSTFSEVREWALSPTPRPPRAAQWLTAAHVGWRSWLAEVRLADATAKRIAEAEASGKPWDNPFNPKAKVPPATPAN